jgi:hypothetical protein
VLAPGHAAGSELGTGSEARHATESRRLVALTATERESTTMKCFCQMDAEKMQMAVVLEPESTSDHMVLKSLQYSAAILEANIQEGQYRATLLLRIA